MSEYVVKIIPRNPFYKGSVSALQSVKDLFERQIDCDVIEVTSAETPVFVDCGANLEKIYCPQCGAELDFDWWGEAMGRAAEGEFMSLETEMPCCKRIVSLNDLNYEFPCGFACCLICIYNPKQFMKDDVIESVKGILGTEVRIIEAHM